eukprot:CAMPEP_0184681324 /NCGR_PEP_ID=MMETSP0312-20130426/4292_1 /TAXON_ID=31354 /ORGANISM="Compsopogon coeruleus, Strain SAG 36.94" /LENGTH=116 /DNA_ID=CAMNT_0027132083 /DNA_START=349 /DNA_END=700 /DNA_ORIENTATION=-
MTSVSTFSSVVPSMFQARETRIAQPTIRRKYRDLATTPLELGSRVRLRSGIEFGLGKDRSLPMSYDPHMAKEYGGYRRLTWSHPDRSNSRDLGPESNGQKSSARDSEVDILPTVMI